MDSQKKSLRAVIFNPEGVLFTTRENSNPLSEGIQEEQQLISPSKIDIKPGAVENLVLLNRMGFKIGLLLLSHHRDFEQALIHLGLISKNIFLISDANTQNYYQEGHKLILLIKECLQQMEVKINETFYVGSTPDDYWAGHIIGMKTLAIGNGLNNQNLHQNLPQPTNIFPEIHDLINFIYELEKSQRTLFLTENIYKTFRGLSSKFSVFSERYGIPPAQMAAMQKLRKKDGVAISQLAKEMGLLLSSISGLVNRMIKQGLITKKKDERDSRVSKIYVTEKGREIIGKLSSFSLEIENYFENYVDKEDLLCLSRNLQKITSVLDTKPYFNSESKTYTEFREANN
ncbi:MAG: MarR family transcriptional regulator [Thermincola sp.]|jgi:DNA-binding MarR family transcriptional regulator/phosphoglycolate phosphatase-like HAD superfamily hydrolase|nr:MarR family transcriptional regulator [Thermincola sp.]MDT3703219.1 MarR family transcriptional regulator [Thermincola sp.]